jgi:hypothetical protein
MNMKPPLPLPPPKWMWEIASICMWPPLPRPSQDEEQKIAVGREKALDLIKEQWTEIKEKIGKMLEMEKIIITRNITEAQGKSKAKLAVEENYQHYIKLQKNITVFWRRYVYYKQGKEQVKIYQRKCSAVRKIKFWWIERHLQVKIKNWEKK